MLKKFIQHFNFLTSFVNVLRKEVPLEKCKMYKTISIGGGNSRSASSNTSQTITIEYYDFSLYSPKEYLVPSYEQSHISEMDALEFANRYIPNTQLVRTI